MPGVSVPVFQPRADQAAAWREEISGAPSLGAEPMRLSYDPAQYPLATLFARHLSICGAIPLTAAASIEEAGLGTLHRHVPEEAQRLDAHEENAVQRAAKGVNGTFGLALSRLLRDIVVTSIGIDCLYQATPTVRVHFPAMAGRAWRDRVHADFGLGHPPQEINVWLPLCRVGGTATMRIASLERSRALWDFVDWDHSRLSAWFQTDEGARWWREHSAPLELDYGDLVVFDSRCLHAAQWNAESYTRVSIDTRVVPVEKLAAARVDYVGTGRMKMRFERGGYYAGEILRA